MNKAKTSYLMKTFSDRLILATIAALVLSATFVVSGLAQGSSDRVSELASPTEKPAEKKAKATEAQASEQVNAVAPLAATAANNYVFATNTSGTFTDMSSGTTQLVGPAADDASSVVTNIGFDFYLLGVRYTQFSASSNGFMRLGSTAISSTQYNLGAAGQTLIAAYGSDLITATSTGKIHFKVTGAAPNRVLVVEFLNETIILDGGAGATADGTYQVRLYETTGVVEFVYGPMNRNSSVNNGDVQWVGFSTSSVDNTYVTVTTATNTANTTVAPASNQPPLSTPIANLDTPVDGSRRTYSFTPATPTAPTGLNFTSVTALAMTLNWTDSPDESLYVVYRSTDGINYNFDTTLPQNTTSYPVSGLNPSTTYFWRVFAVSDGAFSTALSGSQATTAPGNVSATVAGGLWSVPATWAGGVVPTSSDNVTIVDGATVTIDTAAAAFSLNVGQGASGVLRWDTAAGRTLTVGFDVTINSGGTFSTGAAGAVATHVLSLGGNLTNNGTLDFSTTGAAANSCAAGITFTGASNNTFGGTGATTDIRTITLNKGASNANILELNPTNFTVQGTTVDGAPMAFLTLTNGTLKVSGAFTLAGRVFTAAVYTIGATTGFWLNNPNFTVAGQNGSPVNNGLLRISQGTFNVGTASGNAMGAGAGAVFTIEGGVANFTGRLNSGNAVTYTQTAGTVNVSTVGSVAVTTASFGLTSAASTFNMNGGTINLVQINSNAVAAQRLDYQVSSIANVTGGTLNVGMSATTGNAGNFDFRIRGQVPSLVINNTSNNKNVLLTGQTNTFGNVTVNAGTSLNTQANIWQVIGTTITNNGTITAPTNGARLDFLGTGPQTYTGTGTCTIVTAAGTVDLTMDNPAGLTIDPASGGIVTQRVNFLRGGITNSNKLTLGNGSAIVNVVQIGSTPAPSNAGNFDVPPTFNLGAGGQTINYLRTTTARTTGNEVNPTRTLVALTYDDNDPTHTLTIAGGDLTLSNAAVALTMTNGHIVTGVNALALSSGTATVTRTNGYVDGNFRKNFSVAASKVFEVGTANGFSPVTVNATAGAFPALFTVKATQGPQPGVNPATSIQRYWTLTGSGITANLTLQYLPGDVLGNEANYKIIRVIGGTPVAFPTSIVTVATHIATLAAVSSFSDWTVGEISSPTAAPATISGQVTTTNGAPLGGVTVYLSGGASARTITDSNGNYRFVDVDTDNFYTVTPAITNYRFNPANRAFSLLANKTDAIFTALPDAWETANVIDTNEFFVRQQYLDFLGREPDQGGFEYWTGKLDQCHGDVSCVRVERVEISAAFFQSQEFAETGSYVYRLYQGALGRQLSYDEFATDRRQVVGGADLETSKAAFANAFVDRAEFLQKYQTNTTAESFVGSLLQTMLNTTNVDLSGQWVSLISRYNAGSTMNESRALVVRDVAENAAFASAVYNPSFVLMEYFGYLGRGAEPDGYAFWLNVLNTSEPQNYRGMVCSFITSTEYQHRFGTVITRNNSECATVR